MIIVKIIYHYIEKKYNYTVYTLDYYEEIIFHIF